MKNFCESRNIFAEYLYAPVYLLVFGDMHIDVSANYQGSRSSETHRSFPRYHHNGYILIEMTVLMFNRRVHGLLLVLIPCKEEKIFGTYFIIYFRRVYLRGDSVLKGDQKLPYILGPGD